MPNIEIEENQLILSENEVLKNRVFGMPTTKMKRHQRVSFTAMIGIAYDALLENETKKVFEYNTDEFMKLIGISKKRKGSHLFTQIFVDEDGWEQESDEYSLERTLRELTTKEIIFRFKNENKKTYKVEATALLSYFKLTKEKITFEFSEWIRSKILVTDNAYIMKLPIIASFRYGYSVTLFEQIEQRRDFRRWEVSYKVLRAIFGLDDDSYKRFDNFKRQVLNRAVDEINKKSNYVLSYELIKSGRGNAVQKIIFLWGISKNSFTEFKEYIRENFVNKPLVEIPSKDKTMHLIMVSKDGKLYNARNPSMYYTTEKAKTIWKWMYENQDKLMIKKEKEQIDKIVSHDFSKYYGKNFIYEEDTYEHILIIQITKTGKLKIKFRSGEILIIDEKEFINGVLFT